MILLGVLEATIRGTRHSRVKLSTDFKVPIWRDDVADRHTARYLTFHATG